MSYENYKDWQTFSVDQLIFNTEALSRQARSMARNALRRRRRGKFDLEIFAHWFSRIFKKQRDETKAEYDENTRDAKDERGAYERQQLEGTPPPSTGNKAQDVANQLWNLGYDAGMVSGWEEPWTEPDWKEIALNWLDKEENEEAAQAAAEGKPEKEVIGMPEGTDLDKQFMKEVGIRGSSARDISATYMEVIAGLATTLPSETKKQGGYDFSEASINKTVDSFVRHYADHLVDKKVHGYSGKPNIDEFVDMARDSFGGSDIPKSVSDECMNKAIAIFRQKYKKTI